MDARRSELAERLFEDARESSRLLRTTKSDGSITGTTVNISGEDYRISDGSISEIINKVAKFKKKFPEKR